MYRRGTMNEILKADRYYHNIRMPSNDYKHLILVRKSVPRQFAMVYDVGFLAQLVVAEGEETRRVLLPYLLDESLTLGGHLGWFAGRPFDGLDHEPSVLALDGRPGPAGLQFVRS